MQVLWSRAAQARSSCRCRSCLHTATNLARRTTTAVTKRQIKASDIFTACYSTILATAAVADARVKKDRRKEWDRVIAEARSGTASFVPVSPDLADAKTTDVTTPLSNPGLEQDVVGHNDEPAWGNLGGLGTSMGAKLSYLEAQLGDPIQFTDVREARPTVVEDDYVDEGPDMDLPAREPQKPVHLKMMEGMVNRLVEGLIAESGILTRQSRSQGSNDDVQRQLDGIKGALQSLQGQFTSLPTYSYVSIDLIRNQRDALHRSLYTICENTIPSQRANIDLMVAKICYNLLVCTTPPSITTYNILLAELSRLHQHHMAQVVVDSFVQDSKFKPSQVTIKLLLDHYRAKKDGAGFRSIVQRMRGADGNLRVRKEALKCLFVPRIQAWALNNKTIHRSGSLHQKAPRNTDVFDSLIRGHLKFDGPEAAVRIMRSSFREGHRVHAETLSAVITVCLKTLDLKAGLQLLRTVLSLWETGVGFIATVYSEDLRLGFHQLCVMCGFDTALGSSANVPINISWEALQDFLHYLHVESISDSVDRFASFTTLLKETLMMEEPEGLPHATKVPIHKSELRTTQKVDLALRTVDEYNAATQVRRLQQKELDTTSGWRRQEAVKNLRFVRWLKLLEVAENPLHVQREKLMDVETQLVKMMHHRLTPDQKWYYKRHLRINASFEQAPFAKLNLLSQISKPRPATLVMRKTSQKTYKARHVLIPGYIKQKPENAELRTKRDERRMETNKQGALEVVAQKQLLAPEYLETSYPPSYRLSLTGRTRRWQTSAPLLALTMGMEETVLEAASS